MDIDKISKFIYELRIENNLSQNALAELIPIGRSAVSKWECARAMPDHDSLLRLSAIFKVTINEILYGERENKENKEEIKNISLNLYTSKNNLKKFTKVLIISFVLLLLIFLIYFFITNYNSINIYNISSDNISGLIIKTRERIYLTIEANDNEGIENLELYYKDNIITSTTNSCINLKDYIGYEEYFDFSKIDDQINNLKLKINDEEPVELKIGKDFSNTSLILPINKENSFKKQNKQSKIIDNNYELQCIDECNYEVGLKGINYYINYVKQNNILSIKNNEETYKLIDSKIINKFKNNNIVYIYNIKENNCIKGNCLNNQKDMDFINQIINKIEWRS